jgi:histidinol-phosphate phosphatase family protein
LPQAQAALRLLRENDFQVIVVSNQAGLARGAMTESDLSDIHARMKQEVHETGGEIAAIYYCPHDWDSGCECRKPRPGMLFRAQREFHLDLSRTTFIGDDERDGEAAEAAGCRFARVSQDTSFLDCVEELIGKSARGGDHDGRTARAHHGS